MIKLQLLLIKKNNSWYAWTRITRNVYVRASMVWKRRWWWVMGPIILVSVCVCVCMFSYISLCIILIIIIINTTLMVVCRLHCTLVPGHKPIHSQRVANFVCASTSKPIIIFFYMYELMNKVHTHLCVIQNKIK